MNAKSAIIWFRTDLRTSDHSALNRAVELGYSIVPVFIWSPEEEGEWAPGAASQWWLHHSLKSLETDLGKFGLRLILRQGSTANEMQTLLGETGASAVFFHKRYEPSILKRDEYVKLLLEEKGIEVQTFAANLLLDPSKLLNKSRAPYQVFTAFWKRALSEIKTQRVNALAKQISVPKNWPESLRLEDLQLLPKVHWTMTIEKAWKPGELYAHKLMSAFLKSKEVRYLADRDRPEYSITSQLSPHLHFGEITPHQILQAFVRAGEKLDQPRIPWQNHRFVTELGWREFSHYLLFHFSKTTNEPLRSEFNRFPWNDNLEYLKAWQKGRTGYPLVDAGMRELWATGWMHNRVRMVVASFLVKHLRIHWLEGARWFWDTLVDADLAQNTFGWQWSAGCGADAAPYFRVFNPTLQAEKFDPGGSYIRKWVPELARLPSKWIFEPSEAPESLLKQYSIELGNTYPRPMVDHAKARATALKAFDSLKTGRLGSRDPSAGSG